MLTGLHLRHFKSWRDTGPIRLAPVTAFFGANSSGKTSLLQSLLLLRQTVESTDRTRVLDFAGPNALVDLGTAQDIQFKHEQGHPLYIDLSWQEDEAYQVVDLVARARKKSSTLLSSEQLGLEAQIDITANMLSVEHVTYRLGEAEFSLRRKSADANAYDLSSEHFNFIRQAGRPWPIPQPTRFYGFPDQVRLYYQNAGFLTDLELRFEQACSRIHYLGPLREDPKRQYIYSGGAPGDVGQRGELAVDALIASRLADRKVSRGWQAGSRKRRLPSIPLERVIAEWLKELGLIHSFTLETLDDRQTLYRVGVRRHRDSVPVLLTDVGFGVSQVLPVLVLLAFAKSGETIILEQPELHLHPAVQSRLADIIIETALARDVQIIVESHSEHLLARLQRRVAEETLDRGITVAPQDLALYFCAFDQDQSRLMHLDLDLFGNIANWPADFFGNPLTDAVAMVEAAAKRRAG